MVGWGWAHLENNGRLCSPARTHPSFPSPGWMSIVNSNVAISETTQYLNPDSLYSICFGSGSCIRASIYNVNLFMLCVRHVFAMGHMWESEHKFQVFLSFCPEVPGTERRSLDLRINVFNCWGISPIQLWVFERYNQINFLFREGRLYLSSYSVDSTN